MDSLAVTTWACTAMSLYGTYLNIKHDRKGFLFWAVANVFWVWYNFTIGIYALALQFAVYLVLAVVGYQAWKQTKIEKQKLYEAREGLLRIRLIFEDTCDHCDGSGLACDGCLTEARLNFIDTLLDSTKEK